jgi:nucleotide-binding universal stress UspA family protein
MSVEFTAPRRILACVDGSETGYRAAKYAVALASKLESKVYFVNVVGAETTERTYTISAEMVGSFETMGVEALTRCKEIAIAAGVYYETLQPEGDPADEILKSVKETRSDCIVIGRTGLGRLEKLLLGSVSEKVVKFSDVPVILVK